MLLNSMPESNDVGNHIIRAELIERIRLAERKLEEHEE